MKSRFATSENKNKFEASSLLILDDFLPKTLALDLLKESQRHQYEQIKQVREKHYTHVFKSNLAHFPTPSEEYLASFKKADSLSKNALVQEIFLQHIKPMCEFLSNNKDNFYTRPMCVKMATNDLFRIHQDTYGGELGYNFYYPESWTWDWGGIVYYFLPNEKKYPILPKFNRMVFRKEKPSTALYHYVSPIATYSKKERYTINGWCSSIDLSSNQRVFGKYEKR